MTFRPQYVPSLLFGFVLIAGIAYALWPRPVEVDVATVVVGPLAETVDEDGRTRVKDRYVVSAPLAGRLLRIELKAGAAVERGRTQLAAIDPGDPALLDVRAQREAEARVRAAEAAVRQSESRVEESREAHAVAVHDLERAKSLISTKAVAQAEYDRAEHEERRALQARRSAEFALQVSRFELELTQAALVRSRPGDESSAGEHFEIVAPLDGRVLRVPEESARIVALGAPLMELGDPRHLEVEIDVLSADAARIEAGARVSLEQWGGDRPLEGRVRLVEPSGFTKVSALGVEEQRVNVIVDLVDPPETRPTLGDAFRVEARIVVWESASAIKAPVGCLFRTGNEWNAYVVEHGAARRRTVRIGHQNGLEVEVLAGLEPGEQVIVHPSDQVTDATYVAPRK